MIVIPDASAVALIADLIAQITTVYHLIVQPVTLSQFTTLAQLIEAKWPAYSPSTVTSWSPALTVSGRAVSTADPVLWTRGVGGVASEVFGYFVTDTAGGPLLWAELRPQGPIVMTAPDDQLVLLPQLTLRADTSP
ncbi:MAG: hypothetical protein ACRDQ6_05500 [Pseudonocardiaceae bacterium]